LGTHKSTILAHSISSFLSVKLARLQHVRRPNAVEGVLIFPHEKSAKLKTLISLDFRRIRLQFETSHIRRTITLLRNDCVKISTSAGLGFFAQGVLLSKNHMANDYQRKQHLSTILRDKID
jgi:hypothetical protein